MVVNAALNAIVIVCTLFVTEFYLFVFFAINMYVALGMGLKINVSQSLSRTMSYRVF